MFTHNGQLDLTYHQVLYGSFFVVGLLGVAATQILIKRSPKLQAESGLV